MEWARSWREAGGEMGERILSHDWSGTSAGPVEHWPENLKAAAGIMLTTPHPVSIAWGDDLVCLYNDSYASLIGPTKHPRILGMPSWQAWPESRVTIEHELTQVMQGGKAVWQENRPIPIERNGMLEEVFWTYSRSPIFDTRAPHGVGGVITLIAETTATVMAQRQSESRFRALFEQSPQMIHILGPDGQTRAVNPALTRAFGVSADAMLHYNVFHDPQFRQGEHRDALRRIIQGETVRTTPLRHDAMLSVGAGRRRWVEAIGYPVKTPQGELGEFVIIAQDVTDRVEAEEAARGAEARLKIAKDAARLGIFDHDVASGVTVWDQRLRSLWGVDPDTVVTNDVFESGVHPDDLPATREAVRSAFEPEGSGEYRAEYRVINRMTGEERWLAATGRAFFEAGRAARLIGTVEDITERRQTEDALRDSEQRLQIGLEAARLGHWSWDAATDSVTFSDRAYAMFGLEPGTPLTWTRLQALLHPSDAAMAAGAVRQSVASGEDYSIEYRVRRPDGIVWIAARGRPVYARDGRPKSMIGVVQDITERIQAEDQIRLLMAEVNHRSKNLLAVVQAIAHQTASQSAPRLFARSFSERLEGLAASHNLLVRNAWQGVDLADLIQSQLAHFRDLVRSRIILDGAPLLITPAASQAIGLALHELATNAGKYGSLSNDSGTVHISWTVGRQDAPLFRMSWKERGGPVPAEPAQESFGTRLIVGMVEQSLRGNVRLSFPPEGASWYLEAPIDAVASADPSSG